jgi:hypothetical protein
MNQGSSALKMPGESLYNFPELARVCGIPEGEASMNQTALWIGAGFAVVLCLAAVEAGAQDTVKTETVASQPCWVVENGTVRIAIAKLGAQMAPVTFYLGSDRTIEPYYISPWQGEGLKLDPPVLVPLRGDFFCMPFGSNPAPYRGMTFVPHGEPAGSPWSLIGSDKNGDVTTLILGLRTKVPEGKITKTIHLIEGQNVIYSQERLEGYATRITIGHHAIMVVPEREGSLRIATSQFRFGMTSPTLFSNPVNKEYQSFEIGKRFDSLTQVPLLFKGSEPADCTSFPARTGFADLLAVFSEPAEKLSRQAAWTTATNQDGGYLWFSFRDPRVLPMTVFWIENHGRHGVPWNGRNRCLGLEDICGYLNEGMPLSAEPNQVNAQGIPTAVELDPSHPTFVNYIQGVAKVPADFRMVKDVEFGEGEVTFVSVTGKKVTVPVNLEFLRTGRL